MRAAEHPETFYSFCAPALPTNGSQSPRETPLGVVGVPQLVYDLHIVREPVAFTKEIRSAVA